MSKCSFSWSRQLALRLSTVDRLRATVPVDTCLSTRACRHVPVDRLTAAKPAERAPPRPLKRARPRRLSIDRRITSVIGTSGNMSTAPSKQAGMTSCPMAGCKAVGSMSYIFGAHKKRCQGVKRSPADFFSSRVGQEVRAPRRVARHRALRQVQGHLQDTRARVVALARAALQEVSSERT